MNKHIDLACPYCAGTGTIHITGDWNEPSEDNECQNCLSTGVYRVEWDEELVEFGICDECEQAGDVLMVPDDYYGPMVRPCWCRTCFETAAKAFERKEVDALLDVVSAGHPVLAAESVSEQRGMVHTAVRIRRPAWECDR